MLLFCSSLNFLSRSINSSVVRMVNIGFFDGIISPLSKKCLHLYSVCDIFKTQKVLALVCTVLARLLSVHWKPSVFGMRKYISILAISR